MEVSIFSLLSWAFVALGGFSGIVLLLIKLGDRLGWWASLPPQFLVDIQDALADGKISAEEAAKLLDSFTKMKAKE